MPKKAGKKKAGKKQTLKKKALKKTSKKKALKKKASKKKTLSVKKGTKKKTAEKSPLPEEAFLVQPGPQPTGIPPVEEPAVHEEALGVVTHYYSELSVAVVQLNKGVLRVGEVIRIAGHTTDFIQTVESMEYEHQHINEAEAGQNIGLKVKDHARVHDILYRVK